jgi:hypothetical protein
VRRGATTSAGSIDQLPTDLNNIQANLKINCMGSIRFLVKTRHFMNLNLRFWMLKKLCEKQARFQLSQPSLGLSHPSL